MNALVDKAVDMVEIGRTLVYGEVILAVRGLQNAVCETVGQVERGESPYLRGIADNVRGVILVEAEELNAVLVVAQADNVRADLIGDESLVSSCLKADAGSSVPVDELS